MRPTLILDRHEASRWTPDYPYAHISFLEPDEPGYILPDSTNRKGWLNIVVADFRSLAQASEPGNAAKGGPSAMPTPDKFAGLPAFMAEMLPQIEGFAVNCGAGVSRSSGMALALCAMLGHNPRYLYEGRFGHNNRPLDPNFILMHAALIAMWGAPMPFSDLAAAAARWDQA